MTDKKGCFVQYGKLGSMLLEEHLISEDQLQLALSKQKETGEMLGNILLRLKMLNENDLTRILGKQLEIPCISSDTPVDINPDIVAIIPEDVALRHLAVPIAKEGRRLTVAMADPFNVKTLDFLKNLTHHEINPVIASVSEIKRLLAVAYSELQNRQALRKVLDIASSSTAALEQKEEKEHLDLIKKQIETAPVVELVNQLIWGAINERASDIHIEPAKDQVIIHYRIDGRLHEVAAPPKHLQMAIISRLKILSNLDIAEKRLPQDGRFTVTSGNRAADVRLSTLPTIFGEKVTLRVLERSSLKLSLDELNLDPRSLGILRKYIHKPHGMILLTGPTGSGKTTTLYSVLTEIKNPELSIITIEDPVEYQLDGIHQVQVNSKINLTFAAGLRSILRQDPDILMVGEIRDMETAEMAIKASLTGHLVFSTLHTTDSVSSINRLIDIGLPAYLVCAVLRLAVAQRLVRQICPKCKASYIPEANLLAELGIKEKNVVFYYGKGCSYCKHTGYRGRLAIVEMIEVSEQIRNLVSQKATTDLIRKTAIENGMITLLQNGLQRVFDGATTIDEVLRVCIGEN